MVYPQNNALGLFFLTLPHHQITHGICWVPLDLEELHLKMGPLPHPRAFSQGLEVGSATVPLRGAPVWPEGANQQMGEELLGPQARPAYKVSVGNAPPHTPQ